jgi:sulfoacetaldehyde dehydrogenase
MGVVAAVCPSTNPAATPANKTMMALKGRNAIGLSPSPKGPSTCALLVRYIHEQLDKVGAPRDLVQYIDKPSKALTYELMRQADFVVVTGSQKNVAAAYSSGTPAIGVGLANAPVIIDADAELDDAAEKIRRNKTFDYATSCSSENSLHIHADVYDQAIAAVAREGGYLLNAQEKDRLQEVMWTDGKLNPDLSAQPGKIAALAGLDSQQAHDAISSLLRRTVMARNIRSVGRSSRSWRLSTSSLVSTTRCSASKPFWTSRVRFTHAGSTHAQRSMPGASP